MLKPTKGRFDNLFSASSARACCSILLVLCVPLPVVNAGDGAHDVKVPYVDGDWWQITGMPDLGEFNTNEMQPVDFAIWQAADGKWQLWSCIRRTKCGGRTRLFYGWEGDKLTDTNWRPAGVKMQAKVEYGETNGGLQAPHVVKHNDAYHLLYGDWQNICLATSEDGKVFDRYVLPNGRTGMFSEGRGTNTRDIMSLKIGNLWHGYYTAYPNQQGAVYCRTSPDLKNWSDSTTVSFGGRTETTKYSAECPHVIARHGRYYLFRTQKYGKNQQTNVYCSKDPMNLGINQDRLYHVCEMPIAAPEIVEYKGQDYLVALLPSLSGIQVAKLGWK